MNSKSENHNQHKHKCSNTYNVFYRNYWHELMHCDWYIKNMLVISATAYNATKTPRPLYEGMTYMSVRVSEG